MVAQEHWLSEGVSSIPLRSETAFNQLWDQGRLKYINGSRGGDRIDRANAHLACSTLERGLRLLVVLPDDLPQRAPLMFAAALVSQWWDSRNRGLAAGRVIYFGTRVGIREHLSHTRVGSLVLDTVFPQFKPSPRGRTRVGVRDARFPKGTELPKVVCAYSPVDPVALIEDYRPAWIAIDCGTESNIIWLPELLKHIHSHQIPLIAWSRNPLSEVVRDFEQLGDGHVFRWPFHLPSASDLRIAPISVEGSDDRFERCLHDAYRSLAKATASCERGHLATDAIRIAWSLHRSLEQLAVPLELFEAEADHHWGIRRVTRLLAGAHRFIEALPSDHRQFSQHLSDALSSHEQILQVLRGSDPPLWAALRQLCIEDAPTGGTRLIVFSSKARKQMFALALLARFNIAEDDLKELKVSLHSITELQRKHLTLGQELISSPDSVSDQGSELTDVGSVLMTGLPSVTLSTRMLPLLLLGGFDALMYSFQVPVLARRVEDWNASLSYSAAAAEEVVVARSGKMPPTSSLLCDPVITFGGQQVFSVATGGTTTTPTNQPVIPPLDDIAEVSWLLAEDDDEDTGRNDTGTFRSEEEVVWAQEAVEIRFSGGWRGLFALNDTLNVVKQGPDGERVEEQFIRSVRVGDQILFIHGQKRQNLYDLVISRVHNHPAIEIHLALIAKWQEEFAQAFRVRQARGWTVDDVLIRIQARGSSITTSQTIRLWLSGSILAPEDPDDLLRLAESMEMSFVSQYYSRISRAAQRIRGLHRGLSIRLNRWLRERATGETDSDLEVFDEELGLSFQDFRDSLAILRIEGLAKVSGPFLWHTLGTIERG